MDKENLMLFKMLFNQRNSIDVLHSMIDLVKPYNWKNEFNHLNVIFNQIQN